MKLQTFDEILARTLDDRKLSRGERKVLGELLEEAQPDDNARALLRSRVFETAAQALHDPRDKAILSWVEDLVKTLVARQDNAEALRAEAAFSPGETCRQRITGLLKSARECVDICVFTITDDEISRCIQETHGRGVTIRIISDDDKSGDLGSDILKLQRRGLDVAVDQSPAHMHHKFAIFDEQTLLTGSYNWTRSAARENQENVVVTNAPPLVRAFRDEFERLWDTFVH